MSSLKALPLVLDYRQHDFITACVSHLPHLIASSLVELVKDLDGPEELMKRIAAGGFKDITRIASSSPDMWEQICMTNSGNILKALEHYQQQLSRLREELIKKEAGKIHDFFRCFPGLPELHSRRLLAGPLKKGLRLLLRYGGRGRRHRYPGNYSGFRRHQPARTSVSFTTGSSRRLCFGWNSMTRTLIRRRWSCFANTAILFTNDNSI